MALQGNKLQSPSSRHNKTSSSAEETAPLRRKNALGRRFRGKQYNKHRGTTAVSANENGHDEQDACSTTSSVKSWSSRSFGHLANFYSSRRSLFGNSNSVASSTSTPVTRNTNPLHFQRHSVRDGESFAASEMLLDDETSLSARTSDISPRRPKRVSTDSGSNDEPKEIVVHPPSSRNTHQQQEQQQEIHVTPPSDTAPKVPKKRGSFNLQEIHLAKPLMYASKDPVRANDCRDVTLSEIFVSPRGKEQTSAVANENVASESSVTSSKSTSFASVTRRQAFQQSLQLRRTESTRSVGSEWWQQQTVTSNSTDSHGDYMSSLSRSRSRLASTRSLMSCQTHLTLSSNVHTLLELAAEVVNCNSLSIATKVYNQTMSAAGTEIQDVNDKMRKLQTTNDSSTIQALRRQYHEDLRLMGLVIGMLRNKMAILYGEEGDYERAIELCEGAVHVHKHQPSLKGNDTHVSEETEELVELIQLIIERIENAKQNFSDHKTLLDKIEHHSVGTAFSDDITVVSTKEIVFDMIENTAHQDDSASAVTDCDDETIELLSVHAAQYDKHDEAIKYLRDAIQIHMVALGMKNRNTGKNLLRIAKMYRGRSNNRENEKLVLGYFHQTAAVLQQSSLGPRARGSVLNDIAVIHMRRNDFEEAMKFLLDSLHAYDEDRIPGAGNRQGPLVATLQVWRNLGECYIHLGKYRSAEGAFMKALDIQRNSRKIQETTARLQLGMIGVDPGIKKLISDASISDTLCRLGKAGLAAGDHQKALDMYREALAVLHDCKTPGTSASDSEWLAKRDQLTHTLYCIAEACCAAEDCEKALRMYKLSVKLRNSNGADVKDRRSSSRLHILRCFVGIGNLYIQIKEYGKAVRQFKEAQSYFKASQLKRSHAIIKTINTQLKGAEDLDVASKEDPKMARLEKKADEEIEAGSLDMATETLKELLMLRRASLKECKERGADTADQVYAIACLLQTFGFVFAKNGDDENAERAFKDASRLFRKGGNPNHKRETVEL